MDLSLNNLLRLTCYDTKPIEVGVLETIPKVLVKGVEDFEIRDQVETIETTALLRSARILSPGNLERLK